MTKNGDDVAVKMLRNSSLDFKQLRNELYNLRKLNHLNIVQVLGYCFETEQKPFTMPNGSKLFLDETHGALCLEFMHKGSLQRHLSGRLAAALFSICIVRILVYLHLIKNLFCLPLLQMSFLDLNGTHGSR